MVTSTNRKGNWPFAGGLAGLVAGLALAAQAVLAVSHASA